MIYLSLAGASPREALFLSLGRGARFRNKPLLGIADVSQPDAGAAIPVPFTRPSEGVKAETPRA